MKIYPLTLLFVVTSAAFANGIEQPVGKTETLVKPLALPSSCPQPTGFTDVEQFKTTKADQTFTVPPGVTEINVKAWGAAGKINDPMNRDQNNSGAGGYVEATIDVTPGETFTLVVGEKGTANNAPYGFGGTNKAAGSGGGLSGLFTGSAPVTAKDAARAILIAGGGGGSDYAAPKAWNLDNGGGNGGDPTTSGGETSFQGANGAGLLNHAGGGGGYHGGSFHQRDSSQARAGKAGNGGSNFIDTSMVRAGSDINMFTPEDTTDAPNDNDPLYVAGVGVGQHVTKDKNGDGMMIVQWAVPVPCTPAPVPAPTPDSKCGVAPLGVQDNSIQWIDFKFNKLIGSNYDSNSDPWGVVGTYDLGTLDTSLTGIKVTISTATNEPGTSRLFFGGAIGSFGSGHSEFTLSFSEPVDIRRENTLGVAFGQGEVETHTSDNGISYSFTGEGINHVPDNGSGTAVFDTKGLPAVIAPVFAEAYGTTKYSFSWDDDELLALTQNFRMEINPLPSAYGAGAADCEPASPTPAPMIIPVDAQCKENVALTHIRGVSKPIEVPIKVLQQNGSTVEVAVSNNFATQQGKLAHMYAQGTFLNHFNNDCYRWDDVDTGYTEIVTLQCLTKTPIAKLQFFVADNELEGTDTDFTAGVARSTSKTVKAPVQVPNCCHPPEGSSTPSAVITYSVYCEPQCEKKNLRPSSQIKQEIATQVATQVKTATLVRAPVAIKSQG